MVVGHGCFPVNSVLINNCCPQSLCTAAGGGMLRAPSLGRLALMAAQGTLRRCPLHRGSSGQQVTMMPVASQEAPAVPDRFTCCAAPTQFGTGPWPSARSELPSVWPVPVCCCAHKKSGRWSAIRSFFFFSFYTCKISP